MPRVKTYSAASGFVYQYQFESHTSDSVGDRYHFKTNQDRHSSFDVTVLLPGRARRSWEERHQRTLSPTECYALAKMALFEAFDQAARPGMLPGPITVEAEQVQAIAEALDL